MRRIWVKQGLLADLAHGCPWSGAGSDTESRFGIVPGTRCEELRSVQQAHFGLGALQHDRPTGLRAGALCSLRPLHADLTVASDYAVDGMSSSFSEITCDVLSAAIETP